MGLTYLSQTLQCLLLMGLLTRQELQKTLGLKPSSSASSMMVLYLTSWLVRTMPGSDRHDLRKLYLEQGAGSKEQGGPGCREQSRKFTAGSKKGAESKDMREHEAVPQAS